jgi:hypothetical protein
MKMIESFVQNALSVFATKKNKKNKMNKILTYDELGTIKKKKMKT